MTTKIPSRLREQHLNALKIIRKLGGSNVPRKRIHSQGEKMFGMTGNQCDTATYYLIYTAKALSWKDDETGDGEYSLTALGREILENPPKKESAAKPSKKATGGSSKSKPGTKHPKEPKSSTKAEPKSQPRREPKSSTRQEPKSVPTAAPVAQPT